MAEHVPETLDGLAPADVDYLGYDHESLKRMVEQGNDPGQVDGAAAAWRELGGAFARFGDAIRGAAAASETDWQGEAGDAARGAALAFGGWFGGVADGARTAAAGMAAQAEAAATARSAMPEPVDFSVGDALGMLMNETNPLNLPAVMGRIRQRFEEKQRAHAEAAEVVRAYDATLYETGSTMPAFAPPPAGGSDAGVAVEAGAAPAVSAAAPAVAAVPAPRFGHPGLVGRPRPTSPPAPPAGARGADQEGFRLESPPGGTGGMFGPDDATAPPVIGG